MQSATLIEICRGIKGESCPYALPAPEGLADRLRAAVDASGWPEFLAARQNPVRHHHAFKISLSGCANGCSRPHIADFGLIRACEPVLAPDRCTGCGLCEAACPERFIVCETGGPVIDRAACLRCGRCARACPEEALAFGPMGFRLFLGGRLGRRPRFGAELPRLVTEDEAVAILERTLSLFMKNYAPNARLADVLFADGDEAGLARVAP